MRNGGLGFGSGQGEESPVDYGVDGGGHGRPRLPLLRREVTVLLSDTLRFSELVQSEDSSHIFPGLIDTVRRRCMMTVSFVVGTSLEVCDVEGPDWSEWIDRGVLRNGGLRCSGI